MVVCMRECAGSAAAAGACKCHATPRTGYSRESACRPGGARAREGRPASIRQCIPTTRSGDELERESTIAHHEATHPSPMALAVNPFCRVAHVNADPGNRAQRCAGCTTRGGGRRGPVLPWTTSFNTPLFTSPVLSQGKHTINFTVSSDSAIPLYVDYFLIQADSDVTQQGGTAAAASISNSLFESATSTSESSRPSPTFSLPPKDPSSSDPHRLVAEIVGPVAALLVLLIAIFMGRQWTRRTRRSGAGGKIMVLNFKTHTGTHRPRCRTVPFPTSVPETKSAHALNTILAPASPTGAATVQRNVTDEQADDAGSTFSCPPPSYVD
ncbi:hypothetical protein GGX14DRAFT_404850 [Mycena pura]|uniref:Uncharacterized protein n=1 Tax=Mycena pura TaxID=153505 RepID=A0AAD6Y340_9AGAR|nr:hypothetical protein GGX14DRAFT_404850 [Mycena pura]